MRGTSSARDLPSNPVLCVRVVERVRMPKDRARPTYMKELYRERARARFCGGGGGGETVGVGATCERGCGMPCRVMATTLQGPLPVGIVPV